MRRGGVVLALGPLSFLELVTPLAKLLVGDVNPWLLAGFLYVGSGVGLSIVYAVLRLMGCTRAETPLRAPDLPWLGAVVSFGGLLGPILLMTGLVYAEDRGFAA